MLFPRSLSKLVLSAALVLGVVVGGGDAATCTNPSVRREWRKLTTPQKAEWIAAINVRPAISYVRCM